MSDSNVPVGENMWGDRIRSNWSHSGEIIELDDYTGRNCKNP